MDNAPESSETSSLRTKLLALQSRTDKLAAHFGHKDFTTLEKAVGIRVELEDVADSILSSPSKPDENLQLAQLRTELSLKSRETSSLRTQLAHLAAQYDDLLAAKERAAEKYKADYHKWKTFKSWLYKGSVKRAREMGEMGKVHGTENGKGKEKEIADKDRDEEEVFASPVPPPSNRAIANANHAPSHSPSKRPPLRTVPINSLSPESHASPPTHPFRTSSPGPSTSKLKLKSPPHSSALDTARSTDTSLTKSPSKKRKRTDSGAGHKVTLAKLEQTSSPRISMGPNPSPSSAHSPRKLRLPRHSPHKHSPPPRKLDSSPRKQMAGNESDYRRYKGKGRYRTSLPGDAAVASPTPRTSLFPAGSRTTAPDAPSHAHAPFAYEDVERNRVVRKKMHAEDCFCCRDYYDTMNGVLPSKLQAPLWRSPSRSPSRRRHGHEPVAAAAAGPPIVKAPMSAPPPRRHHHHQDHHHNMPPPDFSFSPDLSLTPPRMNAIAAQHHRQVISRHRHHFPTPATPPEYWEIGFPSTQDVMRINERARRMR